MWFCLHKQYSGSISSTSNHLPSSPTSITCAPPSKDVGQVRKCFSMPLKQYGHQPRLPLPSPSTLLHHSTSSVENASPGLLPPSSLPRHLTLSIEDTPVCHHPRTLRFATSWRQASRTSPLVCHCPPLCHVTWRWASRMPCPPATVLSPSALPCHSTLSIEDAPGLPPPSFLPHHLTSSIEDTSPCLPLPYQNPRNAKPHIVSNFIIIITC